MVLTATHCYLTHLVDPPVIVSLKMTPHLKKAMNLVSDGGSIHLYHIASKNNSFDEKMLRGIIQVNLRTRAIRSQVTRIRL